MSVDNPEHSPEQILENHRGRVLTYSKMYEREHHDRHRYQADLNHADGVALAALEKYYKAQASKDMAEVINEDKPYIAHDLVMNMQISIENSLRAEQRKTAAAKGYKVERE